MNRLSRNLGFLYSFVASALCPTYVSAAGVNLPADNPWVAGSPYAISHHNPAQTDVTEINGPTVGGKLTVGEAETIPLVWCSAPLYKQIGNETVVIASNPMGLIKVRATGEEFELISNVPYPNREDVHAQVTDALINEVMADIDNKRRQKQDWRLLFNAWLISQNLMGS